jgi:hypothetical protein
MVWYKKNDGNYINIDTGVCMEATDNMPGSGDWGIQVHPGGGLNVGPYASEAAAKAAQQVLVDGIDPDTLI